MTHDIVFDFAAILDRGITWQPLEILTFRRFDSFNVKNVSIDNNSDLKNKSGYNECMRTQSWQVKTCVICVLIS